MDVLEYWLLDGKIRAADELTFIDYTERQLLLGKNFVKVVISPFGTKVKWAQFAPNWTSLFYVQSWLAHLPAPVTFNFFNSGWFGETHSSIEIATRRLQKLIANSDVKISSRTFVKEIEITGEPLPHSLNEALRHGRSPLEQSIVMSVDFESERSAVNFVGPKSTMARIWGRSPVSFPMQYGNSYDRIVSQGYYTAIRDDRVVRNRVMASMVFPDGESKWCSYERLIFPNGTNVNGLPSVRVLVEEIPSTFAAA